MGSTATMDDQLMDIGDGVLSSNGVGVTVGVCNGFGSHSPDIEGVSVDSAGDAQSASNGPDTLAPATSSCTWRRDEAVLIDLPEVDDGGIRSEKPITIATAFRETVVKLPDHIALAEKVNGEWQTLTYQQYYQIVAQAAKSFIKLGLERYHGVGILGFNASEWFISHLAAIFAGGLSTGIYATNSPEMCYVIASAAECNIIVVENKHQLKKILQIWDRLPLLRAVVQYKGEPPADKTHNVYSWDEFLRLGLSVADSVLDERIDSQAPNKCCTLIYTSGTTGSPKGVMLSHDNAVWAAKNCARSFRWRYGCETMISYLPLSHVAAQIVDIVIPIVYGATIYFAQPDALKGTLGDTLKEVRPTAVFGVPRVWEKIQEKMIAAGKSRGMLSKWIVQWAKRIGLTGTLAQLNGESVPYGWTLASYLIFQSVRAALGFDRCVYFVSAAAPIARETLDFFLSLNIPIMEVYGMSECSGPHTFTLPWQYRLTSVGKPFEGASLKLHDIDKDGSGEVCMRGRHVFMGYLNDERQTREALDEDGWLHSGDVGRIDQDGFLYITGRLKEILITAGGENVAPVPIEEAVKEQLPCISNCMVVGDRKKYLSILLTLKSVPDPETQEPTDMLDATAIEWFRSRGVEASTSTDICQRSNLTVNTIINEGLSRANQRAVSRAQTIQKFTILPRDFSIENGELGPTLKLKRQVICGMYEMEINALYSDGESQ